MTPQPPTTAEWIRLPGKSAYATQPPPGAVSRKVSNISIYSGPENTLLLEYTVWQPNRLSPFQRAGQAIPTQIELDVSTAENLLNDLAERLNVPLPQPEPPPVEIRFAETRPLILARLKNLCARVQPPATPEPSPVQPPVQAKEETPPVRERTSIFMSLGKPKPAPAKPKSSVHRTASSEINDMVTRYFERQAMETGAITEE